ncbi:efflux RND transporter permease subunit, partial [Salmonella enterica subsp. enterica serovar Istanbul]|nr:efflux RND transporter permease subunit [Salmonella enterica subsp. enterica serovar Istanbul]
AAEFGDVIVRENPDGSTVHLRDIGRIELGVETYFQRARLDGKPAGVIAVYQTPGSNALAVASAVKAKMDELKTRFPSDVDYTTSLDTTLSVT